MKVIIYLKEGKKIIKKFEKDIPKDQEKVVIKMIELYQKDDFIGAIKIAFEKLKPKEKEEPKYIG